LIGASAALHYRAVDHVITAEDVIIHKLIAWRPRGSGIVFTGRGAHSLKGVPEAWDVYNATA
jgi:hypothetical protein